MAVKTLDDGIATLDEFGSLPAGSLLGNPTNTAGPVVATGGGSTGQVPTKQADGSWAWATPTGGGAPTAAEYIVASGDAGLSAERVVTAGTEISWDTSVAGQLKAALVALGIGTGKLADGILSADAAGRAKMADGFLTLAKIGAGIFTADATGRGKFAAGFVDSSLLAADSVTGTQIAVSSVGSSELANLAVTFAKNFRYLGIFTAPAANDWDLSLPSGQQGDDVNGYEIWIRGSAASSAFGDILFNGTTATTSSHVALVLDGTTTASAGTADNPLVISATAGNFLKIRIFTKTGFERWVSVESHGQYSGTLRYYLLAGRWSDTSTVFTSLRLRLDGGVNWTSGSTAVVWAF